MPSIYGIPKAGNGKSAYELWPAAGNTGTEADFLDSLKARRNLPARFAMTFEGVTVR
ncbi:hypothetical protein AB0K60_35395 [Thermopolyspora sp. NPDC052614]|uniref:hypothetical protein n=1 Tax=Thermopolyspora sp. NPDC052614 TaxID=3155682 RepID=UPI0034204B8D